MYVCAGDDAWSFLDDEVAALTVPTEVVRDDQETELEAMMQSQAIFAELDAASPFYSLMKDSADAGKLVQPYYIEQLEQSTKDPRYVLARCCHFLDSVS